MIITISAIICLLGTGGAPDTTSTGGYYVGKNVTASDEEIVCNILPAKQFKVGDLPVFKVTIANNSDKTFYLVGSLDDSETGIRYPVVFVTIDGPRDGVETKKFARCGHINRIESNDFVEVNPGGKFNPFDQSGRRNFFYPATLHYSRFVKPGKYTAEFYYSTNEPDIDLWSGSRGHMPSLAILEMLVRVPLIEIRCAVEFEVVE